jgi:hypothetical protein
MLSYSRACYIQLGGNETRIPGMDRGSNSKYASFWPAFVIFTTRFAIKPTANTPISTIYVKDCVIGSLYKTNNTPIMHKMNTVNSEYREYDKYTVYERYCDG